jgi:hypothetical protein
MSAGVDLARDLIAQLDASERRYLLHASEQETEGFLIGRFGGEHSRVAIYNAASHVFLARPEREAGGDILAI